MNSINIKVWILFVGLFLGVLVLPASASDNNFSMSKIYPIDSGHSYIGFQVKYMGYAKVRGRFEKFSGSIYYDPDDITKTSATVVIKTESIDTDLKWRDKDLKSANWFDVENYPVIIFQTTRAVKNAEKIIFYGDLTMHGITKEVALELHENSGILSDTRGDNQIIMTGASVIDRNDFGISGERWSKIKEGIASVAAEIEIELTVLGKQIRERNFRNWVRNENRPPGRIYKVISKSGVEAGLSEFTRMKSDTTERVGSNALNVAGSVLLKEGRVDEAIAVFEHNVNVFPGNSKILDSLAEAYATAGQLGKAGIICRKILKQNQYNGGVIELLRHIDDK